MKMFKDLYKNANASIDTKEAYNHVMVQLEEKPHRSAQRKITEFAALAACLAFTVAGINIYNNFRDSEKITEEIITRTASPIEVPHTAAENLPKQGAQSDSTDENVPVKSAAAPKKDVSKKAEGAPVKKAPAVQENTPKPTTENVKVQIETQEKKPNEINLNALAYEPEPAAMRMAIEPAKQFKTVAKDDYIEYLGKDIEQEISLPEGFINTTPDSAEMETREDELVCDEWRFTFEKNEKSIEVITTKNTGELTLAIDGGEYAKSEICGKSAVLMNDEDCYKAYLVSEDIGYTLNTFGIELNEVETVLESFAK